MNFRVRTPSVRLVAFGTVRVPELRMRAKHKLQGKEAILVHPAKGGIVRLNDLAPRQDGLAGNRVVFGNFNRPLQKRWTPGGKNKSKRQSR